jgi:hypothetical protein
VDSQRPSDAELLDVWERGLGCPPARRALALLGDPETLATQTVGERDAALLRLRELAFGPRLALVAACPDCGERVEASVDVAALEVDAAPAAERSRVDGIGWTLVVRPPTAGDLVALDGAADPDDGRRMLFERCVVSSDVPAAALPEEAVAAAAARLAELDPQADVRLALRCPECDTAWEEPFDPGSFLWQELEAWALRVVRDVHELASVYGWREGDVLAVPPARRRLYLELASE